MLGLFSPACEDRPPLPPVVFEGEHLRYRTFEAAEEVCAGTFFALDSKAGYMQELFGTSTVIDYSWIPDDRYLEHCPAPKACAIGTEAFALEPVVEHEIAHAAHRSAFLPFEEGLAVYFGDGGARDVAANGTLDALQRTSVGIADYGRLGRFVSFLVAEFGLEDVLAIADAAPRGVSPEEFASTLESHLGVPLEEVVRDYEDRYPECPPMNYRHDQPYCDQPPRFTLTAGMGAETVEFDFDLPCDDEATLGTRSGERWRYETFTVPERTAYRLTLTPNVEGARSFVVLEQCGTSCFDDDFSSALESYEQELACLDAGTYVVRLALDDDTAQGFHFSARPVGWC